MVREEGEKNQGNVRSKRQGKERRNNAEKQTMFVVLHCNTVSLMWLGSYFHLTFLLCGFL